MPDAPPAATSYDEVPYESLPFAQTHPSRLFVVGTLFGLRPTPPARCRVLELGCAAGGNLLPMADALPGAEFVGIDLSARQIADGHRLVEQTGLKNVTLKQASVLDVDESYGRFDYVIAHGLFSWVPAAVQEKILAVCAANLTPDGIAYVSYNTYPGWHMRGTIRDMMRYHSGRFDTPAKKVQQARALLDFLTKNVRQDAGAYATLLKAELEYIGKQADFYLLHEHLEEVNDPVYFHAFADRAKAAGLKYLGEARLGSMVAGNFGPEVEKTLKAVAGDQIQAEQYMDFLRNRMFRETLLVPAAAAPNWAIQPEAVFNLHVASSAVPDLPTGQQVNPTGTGPVTYKSATGMTMTTDRPILKAAVRVLREAFPATVPFDRLREQAQALAGRADDDDRVIAGGLVNCYMGTDLIELHGHPVEIVRVPGERPAVSPLVRAQAARGAVANRRHEAVRLGDLDKHLIPLLDGTNDRPALVEKLAADAARGELNVQQNGAAVTDPAQVRATIRAVLDQALANAGRMGVLTG